MEPEVIYTHPNLTLTHYPKGNYIYEEWHGYTSRELFNELLTVILNSLIEKKSHKLILDVRDHPGLGPDGQKDASIRCSDWAKKYGQLWHANVLPQDIFSKFSVKNFEKNMDSTAPVINKYFDSPDEAMAWAEQENP